jgi:hypothetical protein
VKAAIGAIGNVLGIIDLMRWDHHMLDPDRLGNADCRDPIGFGDCGTETRPSHGAWTECSISGCRHDRAVDTPREGHDNSVVRGSNVFD